MPGKGLSLIVLRLSKNWQKKRQHEAGFPLPPGLIEKHIKPKEQSLTLLKTISVNTLISPKNYPNGITRFTIQVNILFFY